MKKTTYLIYFLSTAVLTFTQAHGMDLEAIQNARKGLGKKGPGGSSPTISKSGGSASSAKSSLPLADEIVEASQERNSPKALWSLLASQESTKTFLGKATTTPAAAFASEQRPLNTETSSIIKAVDRLDRVSRDLNAKFIPIIFDDSFFSKIDTLYNTASFAISSTEVKKGNELGDGVLKDAYRRHMTCFYMIAHRKDSVDDIHQKVSTVFSQDEIQRFLAAIDLIENPRIEKPAEETKKASGSSASAQNPDAAKFDEIIARGLDDSEALSELGPRLMGPFKLYRDKIAKYKDFIARNLSDKEVEAELSAEGMPGFRAYKLKVNPSSGQAGSMPPPSLASVGNPSIIPPPPSSRGGPAPTLGTGRGGPPPPPNLLPPPPHASSGRGGAPLTFPGMPPAPKTPPLVTHAPSGQTVQADNSGAPSMGNIFGGGVGPKRDDETMEDYMKRVRAAKKK